MCVTARLVSGAAGSSGFDFFSSLRSRSLTRKPFQILTSKLNLQVNYTHSSQISFSVSCFQFGRFSVTDARRRTLHTLWELLLCADKRGDDGDRHRRELLVTMTAIRISMMTLMRRHRNRLEGLRLGEGVPSRTHTHAHIPQRIQKNYRIIQYYNQYYNSSQCLRRNL